MDYYARQKELIQLADLDESDGYEVDYNSIYLDPKAPAKKRFVLLQASGCSCWEGDGDETAFSSIRAIERFLISDGETRWHPTLEGARRLVKEARVTYAKRVERLKTKGR